MKVQLLVFLLLFPLFTVSAEISDIHIFEKGLIKAIGISEKGQSRFQALTAAKIIAEKNLIEKIKGVSITSKTVMKNSMITEDSIISQVRGLIIGAVSCGEKYYQNDGYAEVCVQMPLHGRGGVYDIVYPVFQMYIPNAPLFTSTSNEGNFIPQKHDGLILDVTMFTSFQPAIINRILDISGRVIYKPSMVSHKLLMETGSAQFATTKRKAKAILDNIGSKNPLIIKSNNIQDRTDVIISNTDAEIIYLENMKSNMLQRARVVYLLR